jgi:hypothetical protein
MWNSRAIHYNLAGYANLATLRNRVEWVRHLLSSSNEKGEKGQAMHSLLLKLLLVANLERKEQNGV